MLPPDQLNDLLSSVDELFYPISGDDPAGDTPSGDARSKLDEYRREIEADPYDPTIEGRPPLWNKQIELAREVLMNQGKHLLVAAQLCEAYTKSYGWGGLLVGLKILRGIVEQCWDRVLPKLTEEDNDPENLSGPFEWLGVDKRGAWFPQTVRCLSLFGGSVQDEGGVTALDFQQAQKNKAVLEKIDKAAKPIAVEVTQKRLDLVLQCQAELVGLDTALADRMQDRAPSFSDLKKALEECVTALQSRLPKTAAVATPGNISKSSSAASTSGESLGVGANETAGSPEGAKANRKYAYSKLEEAASLLEQLEPHSPIPYLIRRAVQLGAMPFPLLMRELIRNDTILTEMNRELGIKDASPAANAGETPSPAE